MRRPQVDACSNGRTASISQSARLRSHDIRGERRPATPHNRTHDRQRLPPARAQTGDERSKSKLPLSERPRSRFRLEAGTPAQPGAPEPLRPNLREQIEIGQPSSRDNISVSDLDPSVTDRHLLSADTFEHDDDFVTLHEHARFLHAATPRDHPTTDCETV
jgi:hypothetical protein